MGAEPTIGSKCVAEFIGTYLLVFTVGCNVLSGNAVWGGMAIASVLMVMIYSLGSICGACFNPAVAFSLAMIQSFGGKGLDWKTAAIYVVVQIAAGLCAALSYCALFWNTFTLEPAHGFGAVHVGLCEMIYSFMLCFVILNTVTAKNNAPNEFYGLAIGAVIVAGGYGAGAVSGGCFNPAVAIGIDVSSAGLEFGWCFWYAVAELVGAFLATVVFMLVRPEDFNKQPAIDPALVSEFIGTFLLVLTVGLNVLGRSAAGPLSIAAALMCCIYSLGDVSGAHFNPAVTIAIFLTGRFTSDVTRVAAYLGAQFLGGLCGALSYTFIHKGAAFELKPGTSFGWAEAGIAEIVFTFVLCFVVLSVAVSTTTKAKTMFGIAIAACITVGGNAVGAISGGSLNPAVSLGIATAYWGSGLMFSALTYSAFEIIGGCLAAGIYKVTHSVDYDEVLKSSV